MIMPRFMPLIAGILARPQVVIWPLSLIIQSTKSDVIELQGGDRLNVGYAKNL